MACLAELVASPGWRFDKSVRNTIVSWETAYGHNNLSIMIYFLNIDDWLFCHLVCMKR